MRISRKLKSLIIIFVIAVVLVGAGTVLKNVFLSQIKRDIQSHFGFAEIHLSLFPPALIIEDVRSTSSSPFFSARKVTVKISYRSLLSRQKPLNVLIEEPVLRIYDTSLKSKEAEKPRLSYALPFAMEKGLIKGGELYYQGSETRVYSKGISAHFTQKKDQFTLQVEAEENVFSWDSAQHEIEGKVSLLAEGRGKEVSIRRIKIVGPDGILNAEGSLKDPFDPEFELKSSFNIQTRLIVDLFDLPFEWEGQTEGEGSIARNEGVIVLSSGFSSEDLVLNKVPMGNVEGKIDFNEKTGGIVEFRAQKKDLPLEYLRIQFKGNKLEGLARRFYLDPIINFMEIPWPISSPVWGNFSIDRRRVEADVEFRDEVLEPEDSRFPLLGWVKIDWDGLSKFSFSSESLTSSFAHVEIEGGMNVNKDVDVSIKGEITDVKQARQFTSLILRKDFIFPEIRGQGSADLRIFGDFVYPQVQAKFSLSPGGFDKFDVNSVEGEAEVIKNDFSGRFNVDDPSLKGKINLFAAADEVRADFQLERGRVESILSALDIPFPLEGEGSGNFEYKENKEEILFKGDFSSSQLKFAGQTLTQVKGKMDWRGDSFSFPEIRFGLHGGTIKGFALVKNLSREFDIDIQGEKINLSSIYQDIEGDLSFDFKGKGVFDQDLASGDFEVKDLYFYPFNRTEATGKVKLGFSEERINLDLNGNFHPGENEFSVSLGMPFAEDSLSGEIKGFFTNFDLLLPWKGAKGRINYLAEIKGPRLSPQLKGAIDFQGPVFPFPRFAHAIRDYSGLVFVENNTLSVRSVRGKLGGGDVQGSGTLELGKTGVEKIDFKAEGENLLLSPLERTRALGDGTLNLIKDADRFVLNGEFFVRQLSWRRELNEKFVFYSTPYYQSSREPQFFDALNLNIRLRADDNAWMENSLGKVRGRFDLTITGNVLLPIVLGDIEAFGGDIYFQDRDFKILRGRVSFSNPMTIEPYLSFTGETYVKDYRVTFSLDGLLDKLNPEFSSSPPLPPEDVLALLALGEAFKRTYHYDRSTQLSTTSFLSFQLSEEVKKSAERLFRIDRFRIDPFIMGSSTEMTARLTAGKKISRNFFILYSTNLATQREEITRIEWELTSDLSIVGIRDELGRISIDVKIHKRF